MIRGIKHIISGFLSRGGSMVFIAMILARLLSFLASWLVLKFVSPVELGKVLFLYSFMVFLIPIAGSGLNQSFIRFAALEKDVKTKEDLFWYSFKNGWKIATTLSVVSIAIGFIIFKITDTYLVYHLILSLSLISFFGLDMLKNYYRIMHKNQIFATIEILNSVLIVICVGFLSYFFGTVGYSIALVCTPLLSMMFFLPTIFHKKRTKGFQLVFKKDYYQYGFFASLANVATQLLFTIDIILIGFMMTDPIMVTHYKYVSLIPFSLLFLPSILITADFVKLTEQIHNREPIQAYINNYWKLFGILSVLILLVGFVETEQILLFFSADLVIYKTTFRILLVGVVGVFMWRGLFGNLLSSIGKAHVNFWISGSSFLLNIGFNYLMIPKYGIMGAGITSAVIMWVSGIGSYILFVYYFKKMTAN